MPDRRGGARPNSGPKKGAKYKPTLEKEAARGALREIVLTHMEAMTAAQIAHAQGIKYLVARHRKTGKFVTLTQELTNSILAGQDDEHEAIEVWEKEPSTPAYTDLMNRALDKPKEQVQELHISGALTLEDKLAKALKRTE